MKLLGLDLETIGTGDSKTDRITEIGVALYDTTYEQFVFIMSQLVCEEGNPEIPENIAQYTGITNRMLSDWGQKSIVLIAKELHSIISISDFVVAHNGMSFDKPRVEEFLKRANQSVPNTLWIDTQYDIDYPESCASRNLMYLSAYHKFLNPFPHRAVFDACSCIRILLNYDLDRIAETARSPFVKVRACVSYDDRQLAKDAYFVWEPATKMWTKVMRKCSIEKAAFQFETKIIGEIGL